MVKEGERQEQIIQKDQHLFLSQIYSKNHIPKLKVINRFPLIFLSNHFKKIVSKLNSL